MAAAAQTFSVWQPTKRRACVNSIQKLYPRYEYRVSLE